MENAKINDVFVKGKKPIGKRFGVQQMKRILLIIIFLLITVPSFAIPANQVIVDEAWIQKHFFWDETPPDHQKTIVNAIKWLAANKYIGLDGETVIKKLVEDDKLFWANFAVTELMNDEQRRDYMKFAFMNYPFRRDLSFQEIVDFMIQSNTVKTPEESTKLATLAQNRHHFFEDVGRSLKDSGYYHAAMPFFYKHLLYLNLSSFFEATTNSFKNIDRSKYAAISVLALYHAVEWYREMYRSLHESEKVKEAEGILKEYQLRTIHHGLILITQEVFDEKKQEVKLSSINQ